MRIKLISLSLRIMQNMLEVSKYLEEISSDGNKSMEMGSHPTVQAVPQHAEMPRLGLIHQHVELNIGVFYYKMKELRCALKLLMAGLLEVHVFRHRPNQPPEVSALRRQLSQ